MPKLHNISKKFLKEQGCNQCLANSEKIVQQHQQQDDFQQGQHQHRSNVRHTDSINHQNEGKSSGNNSGIEEDESKMKAGRKRSYPEEVEVDVLSLVDETNHQSGVIKNYYNEGEMNTTTTTTSSMQPPVAAAAGVSTILQRRSDDCIWVQIGQTQHPAFELYNPDNPDHDSSTVWVEYTSNKQRECVSRSQIKYGLQDRRRQRPKFYH